MKKELSHAAAERAEAQAALARGDLKPREEYTAKQVASRCGTDAKTMRKFFRSSHSTVEPVGQGGRYVFDSKDFPQIKREFDAWTKRASVQKRATQSPRIDRQHAQGVAQEVAEEGEFSYDEVMAAFADQEAQELAEEPTDEEILEMDDLELDDLEED